MDHPRVEEAGDNLQEANLQEANLQEANLQEASLRVASLRVANRRVASLQGAILPAAGIRRAVAVGGSRIPTRSRRRTFSPPPLVCRRATSRDTRSR